MKYKIKTISEEDKAKKTLFRKAYSQISMKDKYFLHDIETIGYLDIETSGLTADFDIMLSYAILIRNIKTGKIVIKHGVVDEHDFELARKTKDADSIDKRILLKLLKDMEGVDCFIGHWFIGKHRHDIPFIRTRCAINKIKSFPQHKAVKYGDTQKWGSLLFRLHSNGLESMASMFNIHTQKTKLKPKTWKNACIGVKKDLDYILDHNIKDVKITYKVHKALEKWVPVPNTYA